MTSAVGPTMLPGTRFEIIPDQIETVQSYRAAAAFLDANMIKPPKSSTAGRSLRFSNYFLLSPQDASRLAVRRLKQIILRKKHALLSRTEAGSVPSSMPSADRPVFLWFGNHGSPHSNFGMLSLFQVAPALEKLAQEFDFELWVISNDRNKYESAIAPLRFRSRYFEWSPSVVFSALRKAKACLFPSTGDDFSETKSANRVVMALQHGVPAVASPIKALEPLGDAVLFENWEHNLRQLLTDPETAKRCLDKAKPVLDTLYSSKAIGRQWDIYCAAPTVRRLRAEIRAAHQGRYSPRSGPGSRCPAPAYRRLAPGSALSTQGSCV